MSYIIPKKYKCDNGHEIHWTPSAPMTLMSITGEPVCPRCLSKFFQEQGWIMTPKDS